MKNIVIFSGTTEGRLLAELFAAAEIPVTVCVATEYGKEVMTPDPFITIHSGRMDASQMTGFMQDTRAELVYDATHPYAVEVSENIRRACDSCGIPYKRIERQTPVETHDDYSVTHVKSLHEAVQILELSDGNIFLTTGSKELKDFISLRDRLYVRVLPSAEAIGICDDCGIEKSHIIAEQGPFTYDENLAVIRRYGIGVLVTKNSGRNGGYDEKLRAAEAAGIPVITIDRPVSSAASVSHQHTISVIGAGCGEKTLTLGAAAEIRRADLIIATSRRLLDYGIVKRNPCPKHVSYKSDEIAEMTQAADGRVVVLFSGDTGFYSGSAGLLRALPSDADVRVYPGISAIAAISARTHIPYDHAAILSYHGIPIDEEELANTVSENPATFLLLSGRDDVMRICGLFPDRRIFIALDMGTDHEWTGEVGDTLPDGSLYTVIICTDS